MKGKTRNKGKQLLDGFKHKVILELEIKSASSHFVENSL
jgi:hypothetical protein